MQISNVSNDVSKMTLPLTLVWLALTISLLVYGGFLLYAGKSAMVDINISEQNLVYVYQNNLNGVYRLDGEVVINPYYDYISFSKVICSFNRSLNL